VYAGFKFGKRNDDRCAGPLSQTGSGLIVDCRDCSGNAEIASRRCFMGLAERIPLGFSGDIVIRSATDKLMRGSVVTALMDSSDIIYSINSIGGESESSPIGMIDRIRLDRMRRLLLREFKRDPSSMIRKRSSISVRLKKIRCRGDPTEDLRQITEETERMIARLKGGR
jgi:hypothetical protein